MRAVYHLGGDKLRLHIRKALAQVVGIAVGKVVQHPHFGVIGKFAQLQFGKSDGRDGN